MHVSYFEAEQYCKFINGRLPSFEEWSMAAYTQVLDSKVFEKNKTYSYPSGDKAEINAPIKKEAAPKGGLSLASR